MHADHAALCKEHGMFLYVHGDKLLIVCDISSYSMLPAVTTNGIIYSDIKVGGNNGDEFLSWLEGLLQQMHPYPNPHSSHPGQLLDTPCSWC